MKVAVLGGTGFLGYDCVRRLIAKDGVHVVVYSTSAQGLSNLARHNVDLRLVPYSALSGLVLERDTELVVNFAHPFGARDGLATRQQLRLLACLLRRQLRSGDGPRVIHVSSMSVYEPFRKGHRFGEAPLRAPPRSDGYARGKYRLERVLQRAAAPDRLLIIRPTVVYGPFCRPWTDNLLAAFAAGDVMFHNLDGLIQPVLVDDVSQFILERLHTFKSGVYNFAGPAEMSWAAFFTSFRNIVNRGNLVRSSAPVAVGSESIILAFRSLLGGIKGDRRAKDIATRVLSRLPPSLEGAVRSRASAPDYRRLSSMSGAQPNGVFCLPFFAADRLVSTDNFNAAFPAFTMSDLRTASGVLEAYYRYRFTDSVLD